MAEKKNDKVYIVVSGEYSDYHISTVFTDPHDAEVYCAVNNGGYVGFYGDYRVEEFEIGKIEYQPDKKIGYWFSFEENGTLDEILNFMPHVGKSCIVPNMVQVKKPGGETLYTVGVMATSREQAEKIAQDLIAKYKAEKEGVKV